MQNCKLIYTWTVLSQKRFQLKIMSFFKILILKKIVFVHNTNFKKYQMSPSMSYLKKLWQHSEECMCRLRNVALESVTYEVWQTDGQTDRQTDRQTDGRTDRRTKWSLCVAMLRRRHNNVITHTCVQTSCSPGKRGRYSTDVHIRSGYKGQGESCCSVDRLASEKVFKCLINLYDNPIWLFM